MNAVKRFLAPVGVAALALSTQVHAALPAGSEAAITGYQDDVVTVIGLMITAGIAIFAVRKLGSKMGWL